MNRAPLLLCLATAALAAPLAAQLPPAEEARRLLETRPDLTVQLRERILASGLSAAQIRSRLVAAGYPADLLDPYLPEVPVGGAAVADDRVFAAVRALGLEPDGDAGPTAGSGSAQAMAPQAAAAPVQSPGIFGMEIFSRAGGQFQPNLAGPVDPSYRLGPGDNLVLILTGEVELSHALEVTREGFLVIPQVGQVQVNGLTMAGLESLLYDRLGRVYSGVRRGEGGTTRFQVSMARVRTNQVFVVGDVRRPSAYQVAATGTVLTALYAAGGPTENGSFRAVQVRRGGRLVATLDLYDYLLRGDNRHDVRLESGDVIFVPVRGTWAVIGGEVVRPAIYELAEGETLRDLVAAAGGFRPTAAQRRIQVDRILAPADRGSDGRDRIVLDLGPDQFATGTGPAFPVQAGDVIRVFSVADRLRGFVTVRGNVWTEGRVALVAGLRLSEAIRQAGGAKADTYLGQILISRLNPDSTRTQLRSAFADAGGAVVNDLVLQEDDLIEVFSRTTFRPDRFVIVTGAVRNPGRLPWRDGMTLRDAVLLAGGMTEAALLREAEIARLPASPAPGVMAVTYRAPLDSTYLPDRAPDGTWRGPPGLGAPARGSAEVPLQPYDNVLILRQPEWELPRTVAITGQVQYPGTYTLRTRTERLTDLIERAGGLTAAAYPAGIGFFRATRAVPTDPDRGADQPLGAAARIGIDLPAVLADAAHRDNVILAAGDSVFLPEFDPIIRVGGAVLTPAGVTWQRGRNLRHYVDAAGGFERQADRGRAYVVQPNGKIEPVRRRWFILPDGLPTPEPGAMVVVPLRERSAPRAPGETASLWTGIASILASTVAILVVATR